MLDTVKLVTPGTSSRELFYETLQTAAVPLEVV